MLELAGRGRQFLSYENSALKSTVNAILVEIVEHVSILTGYGAVR